MTTWKLFAEAPRQAVLAALDRHAEMEDWDGEFVVAGREVAEDRPDEWVMEAWLPRRPTRTDKAALADLFLANAPAFTAEKLAEEDWLALSQQGLEPIRAGRFHVRTADHPPLEAGGVKAFVIPAAQAFGTGQHETTAGCLAMLDRMKRSGIRVDNHLDLGTGTGLLAFAAMHLWPRAYATASDIDPVCAGVVHENCQLNDIAWGARRNELAFTVADGLDDALLAQRAPYDLVIANILAGPLMQLAPDIARSLVPGGSVVLAGLLSRQEPAVRAAYRRAGFRMASRHVRGDWSILWLRKRRRG